MMVSQWFTQETIVAPAHPLAKKLELPLLDLGSASVAEIRKKQKKEQIPGVVKRLIPWDNNILWEYWWCVPGRILLAEDVELLQSDRPRVEKILAQLMWLWGGYCFNSYSDRTHDAQAVYDWQQVITFVQQQGLTPDVLDIDFFPLAMKLQPQDMSKYIAVEPPHWHVEFFQLQSVDGAYELPKTKPACSCQIWTTNPFIKHLATGEKTTRFDLWISRPLDLTNPPWRSGYEY